MRRLSCAILPDLSRVREVTVFYRMRWRFVRPGDEVLLVDRIANRSGGEAKGLSVVRVVSIRETRLIEMTAAADGGRAETDRCGFWGKTPQEFVDAMCDAHKTDPWYMISRIEVEHAEPLPEPNFRGYLPMDVHPAPEGRVAKAMRNGIAAMTKSPNEDDIERWDDDGGPAVETEQ
jgi:hypothetical protein